MLQKISQPARRSGGFLPYSIYRPEVHALLKEFIKDVVPPMKDKPALFSICLSNEPINCEDVTTESSKDWHDWLTHRHGDIATLNALAQQLQILRRNPPTRRPQSLLRTSPLTHLGRFHPLE